MYDCTMIKLKSLRQAQGLTQMDLAHAAGVPQATVSQIERGTNNPNLTTLAKLAEALGLSLPDMFDAGEAPAPVSEMIRRFSKLDPDQQAFLLQTADTILAARSQQPLEPH